MILKELLALHEGSYIVKNKDGKEKRFKDSASIAASEWTNSSSPTKKPKAIKYSQDWWDDRNDEVLPNSPIDKYDLDDKLADIFKNAIKFDHKNIDHWTSSGRLKKEIDGVQCLGTVVRVMYSFGADDDMGLDVKGDERLEDSVAFSVFRSPKNPSKFIFGEYT